SAQDNRCTIRTIPPAPRTNDSETALHAPEKPVPADPAWYRRTGITGHGQCRTVRLPTLPRPVPRATPAPTVATAGCRIWGLLRQLRQFRRHRPAHPGLGG